MTTSSGASAVHQRPHHQENEGSSEASPLVGVDKPKNVSSWMESHGHLSMMEAGDETPAKKKKHTKIILYLAVTVLGLLAAVCFILQEIGSLGVGGRIGSSSSSRSTKFVSVEDAEEHWLDIGNGLEIWFRTWGRPDGIPVVFIHGGPGNAIADYFGNSNQRFFQDANHTFFVVEIDQRGTGNSQPSVRDDWKNMKYYKDISIDKMCHDFEQVREHLGIDEWLVWGGSFGSTLAINYGERYPESCMALIIRGIYLDTAEEVYAIYSRESYLDDPKRLREFNILYDYAAQHMKHNNLKGGKEDKESSQLDPNDAERLLRVYAEMIASGDRYAIWHWFVFENNLMEIDPEYILDPENINNKFYRESLSVAFFETHLWLHGSFEKPTSDLMNTDKIDRLTMPLWVCQGQHDEVCPPKYARRFVDAVETRGKSPRVVSRFLNGTHEDTDPAIEECLKWSLREFVESRRTP